MGDRAWGGHVSKSTWGGYIGGEDVGAAVLESREWAAILEDRTYRSNYYVCARSGQFLCHVNTYTVTKRHFLGEILVKLIHIWSLGGSSRYSLTSRKGGHVLRSTWGSHPGKQGVKLGS